MDHKEIKYYHKLYIYNRRHFTRQCIAWLYNTQSNNYIKLQRQYIFFMEKVICSCVLQNTYWILLHVKTITKKHVMCYWFYMCRHLVLNCNMRSCSHILRLFPRRKGLLLLGCRLNCFLKSTRQSVASEMDTKDLIGESLRFRCSELKLSPCSSLGGLDISEKKYFIKLVITKYSKNKSMETETIMIIYKNNQFW